MRIIAGEFKNRALPGSYFRSVKVTSDYIRQVIFNMLGDQVAGCRFADLFAGSGLVGLEALSRGAERVTFVEQKRSLAEGIRQTLSWLEVGPDRARVWHNDVFKLQNNPSDWAEWDIVFLDPPGLVKEHFLDILVDREIIAPRSLVILERPRESAPEIRSEKLQLVDQRTVGESILYFFHGIREAGTGSAAPESLTAGEGTKRDRNQESQGV